MFTQTHNFWLGHLDARNEFTLMQGFDNPLESIFFIEQEIRKAAKPYPRYLHACSMLLQWNPHDIYAPQTQLNLRLIDYSNAITAEINPRQNNLSWYMHNANNPIVLSAMDIENPDRRPCALDDKPILFDDVRCLQIADQTLTAYIKESEKNFKNDDSWNYMFRQITTAGYCGTEAGEVVCGIAKLVPMEKEKELKCCALAIKTTI